MTVIRVENLSKSYRLGEISTGTFFRDFERWFARVRGKPDPYARIGETDHGNREGEELWALRDVSFEVKQGEVLGIIGRNGAGKSTLLKILSRVTAPTSGQVKVKGRIASLLEVGTGFHPELTGRENIYLNGAILGMTKAEVRRKFDEIVDFAGVEQFVDTPVKRYSSGMYVRLAFAVAAHLEPEILVVDEVLAVGDAEFQKKCLGKMGEVAKGGRTVLFVSHNMGAVQSLCARGVLLEAGRVELDDRVDRVITHYMNRAKTMHPERIWDNLADAPGNEAIRLRRVCVRPADGNAHDMITVRTPIVVEFEYWNLVSETKLNLSVAIYNELGTFAFITTSVTEPTWHGKPFPRGLFRSVMHIPGDLLNDGLHSLTTLFVENEGNIIATFPEIISFDVEDSHELRGNWHGKWNDAVRPLLVWETLARGTDNRLYCRASSY